MGIENGVGYRNVKVTPSDSPKTYKKVKEVVETEPHIKVKAVDDDASSVDVLVVAYDSPKDWMPVVFVGDTPPAIDPGLYPNGGTLTSWKEARNKCELSVFEDGVMATLDSTSPCGPAVKLEGMTGGADYNIKFRFEQDSGPGYSSVRFGNSDGLYVGEFASVSNPDIEEFDVTLTAASATMYLGALRINHAAGAFIKISEISINQV